MRTYGARTKTPDIDIVVVAHGEESRLGRNHGDGRDLYMQSK